MAAAASEPEALDAFVAAYFAQYRAEVGGSRDERMSMRADDVEHRSWQLDDMIFRGSEAEVEAAWPMVLALVEHAPDDACLGYVVAGPLEDIVLRHHERFGERLIAEARRDAGFRLALSGVWGWERLPRPLADRLLAIAGFPDIATGTPTARPPKRRRRT